MVFSLLAYSCSRLDFKHIDPEVRKHAKIGLLVTILLDLTILAFLIIGLISLSRIGVFNSLSVSTSKNISIALIGTSFTIFTSIIALFCISRKKQYINL